MNNKRQMCNVPLISIQNKQKMYFFFFEELSFEKREAIMSLISTQLTVLLNVPYPAKHKKKLFPLSLTFVSGML
jgi:hypothetical protein